MKDLRSLLLFWCCGKRNSWNIWKCWRWTRAQARARSDAEQGFRTPTCAIVCDKFSLSFGASLTVILPFGKIRWGSSSQSVAVKQKNTKPIGLVFFCLCKADKKDVFKCFRIDLNSRTKSRRRRAYHQNEVLYIAKAKALYIIRNLLRYFLVKYSAYAECEIIPLRKLWNIAPSSQCEMKFASSHLRSKYFTAELFHMAKPYFTRRRRISLKKAHIVLVDKCVLFSGGDSWSWTNDPMHVKHVL